MMDEHQQHHSNTHHEHKPHEGMPEIPKIDMKNVNADSLKGGFGDIIEIHFSVVS